MSASSSDEDEGESWHEKLKRIRENDPHFKSITRGGEDILNMTDEESEELGRDIANNTHLTKVDLSYSSLNDQKMSFIFRGLTRSISIEHLKLRHNRFGAIGARSMVPFLQNANSRTHLDLSYNHIQSEGFNMMCRALCDSPIETLTCRRCGIESIDIDGEHIPRHLKSLLLSENSINADGCRELAKLLQGGDATLDVLTLNNNRIDDEGVEILVDVLQNNTSLTQLFLEKNHVMSKRGQIMLLKLVNNISSIEATLRSNQTLTELEVSEPWEDEVEEYIIQRLINVATDINRLYKHKPERAGRGKVIKTQLHNESRAELAELQGVHQSIYSQIDPLLLPEVLSIIGRRHGQGGILIPWNLMAHKLDVEDMYVALKSSVAGVISIVNRKACIQEKRDFYVAMVQQVNAKVAQLNAELVAIEAAEGGAVYVGSECRNSKRRRQA
mmetsp:Transcript_5656/g.9285  ORF Transcript_5656/g.9285 Transcript_5656/m.9285 type:complete len:443 (+) Transcript_5656:105-1433(+)